MGKRARSQNKEAGAWDSGGVQHERIYNPFLALKRPETTETFGEAIGFSLVYSGNFLAQAEVDTYDVTRITMGIHPDRFSWELNKEETFQTPEAVMVYSDAGLNGMSQIFHKLYRTRLVRGKYRECEKASKYVCLCLMELQFW